MVQAGPKSWWVVGDVQGGLTKLSDQDMRQLTRLLFIDEKQGDGEWVDSQKQQMKQLPACLRRPRGLISRLAIRMGQHGAPFWPEAARLCMMHKKLDARVIRRLMTLVANECVMHANRLRGLRRRNHGMEAAVRCWLERVDSLTSLWMDRGLFEQVFGREPETGMRPRGPTAERDRCEACMLAVFGTDTQALVDTRASLVARYATQRRRKHNRQPRLLRVVEAWIDNFDAVLAGMIRVQSESLAPSIARLRTEWRQDRERRRVLYPRSGQAGSWTEMTREGLPVPRRNIGLPRDERGKPQTAARGAKKLTRANVKAHGRMSTTAVYSGAMMARGRRGGRRGVLDDDSAQGVDVRKWLEGVAEAAAAEEEEEEDGVERLRVCVDADYYEYVGGTPAAEAARSCVSSQEEEEEEDGQRQEAVVVMDEDEGDWRDEVDSYYFKEAPARQEQPAADRYRYNKHHHHHHHHQAPTASAPAASAPPDCTHHRSSEAYMADELQRAEDARLMHDLQQCGIGIEGLQQRDMDDDDGPWSSSVYSSESNGVSGAAAVQPRAGGAPPGNWI
ncbi:hypothetical protein CDD82_7205 [Ophiocordyceps australis]|uniref:Uncharacterized protein n=1 Tax=Ophiocordyceps australis TaxID=1399860 RepID=A0A2C5YLD4_9HYPO|nr:hypothetical protein CDD82_7205 [Ophiocordyceps australis]